jgi:hypothetical protein
MQISEREYRYRIDFYPQAAAMYLVALLVWVFLVGSRSGLMITVVLSDPILLLLGFFTVVSLVMWAANAAARRTIVVGADFVEFRNRWRSRRFAFAEIASVALGKERLFGEKTYRLVRMRVHSRRRPFRIRPVLYSNHQDLLADLLAFKQRYDASPAGRHKRVS